jgi:hypothetical protein
MLLSSNSVIKCYAPSAQGMTAVTASTILGNHCLQNVITASFVTTQQFETEYNLNWGILAQQPLVPILVDFPTSSILKQYHQVQPI